MSCPPGGDVTDNSERTMKQNETSIKHHQKGVRHPPRQHATYLSWEWQQERNIITIGRAGGPKHYDQHMDVEIHCVRIDCDAQSLRTDTSVWTFYVENSGECNMPIYYDPVLLMARSIVSPMHFHQQRDADDDATSWSSREADFRSIGVFATIWKY